MEAKPVSKTLLVVSCILLAIVTRTWVSGQATQSEKDRQEFWVRAKFWQIERLLLLYHEEHGAFCQRNTRLIPMVRCTVGGYCSFRTLAKVLRSAFPTTILIKSGTV
jgi:hypothetical protein